MTSVSDDSFETTEIFCSTLNFFNWRRALENLGQVKYTVQIDCCYRHETERMRLKYFDSKPLHLYDIAHII